MKDSAPGTPAISALIITYNEIENIGRCLASIDFATEIVVVDSYSTDGTYEYLLEHPRVRVLRHPFKNFTAQKNFALQHAQFDWVLFIDADEVVPPGLGSEIRNTVANPPAGVNAFWYYRKFMFKGSPIRFSGWQTDKNIRLFRKSKARYSDQRIVHERLDLEGRSACLSEKLVHYCYKNYSDYKGKMLLYGKLKAHEAFSRNRKFSYAKLILKPFWKFFFNYVCRFGFLDGSRGLTLCYLGALEDFQRYRVLRSTERDFKAAQYSLPTLSKKRYLVSDLAS